MLSLLIFILLWEINISHGLKRSYTYVHLETYYSSDVGYLDSGKLPVCAAKCVTSVENCVGFSVEANDPDPCHLHLQDTTIEIYTQFSGFVTWLRPGKF